MRETSSSTSASSRGGALVSAVVAVLEKQQQNDNNGIIKRSPYFKNTTSLKNQSVNDNSPANSQAFLQENCDHPNSSDSNSKSVNKGVIIKEFIYKDVRSSPLLFVKQKDPKLIKNTSYVIVKESESNQRRSPSDNADENVGDNICAIEKCSPFTNTTTKNKPHNIQIQTLQENNSGSSSSSSNTSTKFVTTQVHQIRTNNNTNSCNNTTNIEKTTLATENNLQDAADRNFEKAIKNFDRTAEDVQNYVLKNKYKEEPNESNTHNFCEEGEVIFRNKFQRDQQQEKERFSSTTDYTSNVSDDFDTNSSSNESSTSDDTTSEQGEEHINELETITEEDRTAGSSFKSTVGEINDIISF